MKSFLFAAALLVSGAAIAQTTGSTGNHSGHNMGQTGTTGQAGTGQSDTMGQGSSMGQSGTAGMSGPATAGNYPPCSRTITDSCIQTYERGVRRSRPRR
jgi:hypothetical protein